MKSAARTLAESGHLMTLEQWAELDEDVEGELVDGVLEEEEMPTYLHEIIVTFLVRALSDWGETRGRVVVGSEAKIAVGPRSGRKPDLSVFGAKKRPALSDSVARVAPEIVVEVTSPRPRDARRDRVDKLHDYAGAGVRGYWIIDPAVRSVEILVLRGKTYVHALSASTGALPKIPGCPGLTLDLDKLWLKVDSFEAPLKKPRRRPAR